MHASKQDDATEEKTTENTAGEGRCPICWNRVTEVSEKGGDTHYSHEPEDIDECVAHSDGRVTITWDSDTLLGVLARAEGDEAPHPLARYEESHGG